MAAQQAEHGVPFVNAVQHGEIYLEKSV